MTASPSSAIIVPTAIALVQERILSSSPPSKGMSPSPQLHRGSSISLLAADVVAEAAQMECHRERLFLHALFLEGGRARLRSLLSNAASAQALRKGFEVHRRQKSLSTVASPDLERRSVGKNRRISFGSACDDDYARIALSYGAQALRYARIWKSFLAFLNKGAERSIVIGEQCAPLASESFSQKSSIALS